MNKKDSLGDRMKKYETVSKYQLTPRTPVIIRIDGRAFHTFTRGCDKPFDKSLNNCMVYATKKTAQSMQGFKLAYTQSDEASFLLTDFDEINTQGWFDYSHQKIISISASTFTAHFIDFMSRSLECCFTSLPTFDARAFNVPLSDVANYFLWRSKDWERNSLTMYSQSFFSHKELMGKNASDKHEMLHSIGKNWATDVDNKFKNGTFILKTEGELEKYDNIIAEYAEIDDIVNCSLTNKPKETISEKIRREMIQDSGIDFYHSYI